MSAARGAARYARANLRGAELAAFGAYWAALTVAARHFGVDAEEAHVARSEGRPHDPRAFAARKTAIYLAVTAFNRSVRSVAGVAGVSHTAAWKAARTTEDRRDDEDFDRALDALEAQLTGGAT